MAARPGSAVDSVGATVRLRSRRGPSRLTARAFLTSLVFSHRQTSPTIHNTNWPRRPHTLLKPPLKMGGQKAIIVGLSGCSSSGKTTLARLLRDIFPNSFVLHEDDFYRPEDE